MKKGWKIFLYVLAGLFLLGLLIPSKPPISKAIEKDSHFQYATSITGKADQSDRANVYTIDMTVPEAAKYIMSKERPESYTDLNNQESIQLVYDDYYILIYKGENAKTFVQTSSRKYVHQNGYYGMYRPFNPGLIILSNRHYTSGGYSSSDSQRYGRGIDNTTTSTGSSTKIRTDDTDSSKIRTDSSSSSKIRTSSGSVRSESTTARASVGGGTSFGK